MIITGTLWFTNMQGSFGIVMGQDDITKERKAYIGPASGTDEESDALDIKNIGAPIRAEQAKELYDFFNPTT